MIYFIGAEEAGPIKIGTTRDINTRFRSIQSANFQELEILGCFPGSYEQEALLHRAFCDNHIRGEWFSRTEVLLQVIEDWSAHGFGHVKPSLERMAVGSWGINKKTEAGVARIRASLSRRSSRHASLPEVQTQAWPFEVLNDRIAADLAEAAA